MAETLAELVRTRLDELGLGVREAARGHEPVLYPADISALQLGKLVAITPAKVRMLALALRVPVERVQAARHVSLTSSPLELPGRLNLLGPDMRKALVSVGDALLRLQEQHGSTPDGPAADTPASTEARPGQRRRRT